MGDEVNYNNPELLENSYFKHGNITYILKSIQKYNAISRT